MLLKRVVLREIMGSRHGVSIGYDWFYDDIPAAARATIEDGLVTNGIAVGNTCWDHNCTWTPGVAGTGACESCWWTRAPMNWNPVSNASTSAHSVNSPLRAPLMLYGTKRLIYTPNDVPVW